MDLSCKWVFKVWIFFQWGILFRNSIIVLFPSFVIEITYSLPQVAVSTLRFYIFIVNTEEMSNIFLQCVCLVKWSHENIWQHRCIRHRDSFVCFGWFCLSLCCNICHLSLFSMYWWKSFFPVQNSYTGWSDNHSLCARWNESNSQNAWHSKLRPVLD